MSKPLASSTGTGHQRRNRTTGRPPFLAGPLHSVPVVVRLVAVRTPIGSLFRRFDGVGVSTWDTLGGRTSLAGHTDGHTTSPSPLASLAPALLSELDRLVLRAERS